MIIKQANIDQTYFGAIVQYPNDKGSIEDYREFIQHVHAAGAFVVMATDLLALTLLTPPGELGADVRSVLPNDLVCLLVMADLMLLFLPPKMILKEIFPDVSLA